MIVGGVCLEPIRNKHRLRQPIKMKTTKLTTKHIVQWAWHKK